MKDQAQALRDLVNSKQTTSPRVITVTSGKGGVGKSNISVNLSLCLVQLGYKVALLDADLGMANVDILLGMSPTYTLTDVLYGDKQIKDIMMSGPGGLQILAGGSGVYDLANLNQWHLEQFVQSVEQIDHSFDFIIVDTGGGIHRNVLSFVLATEEILVVTTPEPTAITDAYGMIKVIKQKNPNAIVSVTVNMVHSPKEGELVWRKLNTVLQQFLNTQVDYAGYVLYDTNVAKAVSEQKPLALAYPSSLATRSIERLAHGLAGATVREKSAGIRGFFGKMYDLLQL